jgi:6-phosphogluconolactonase
MLIMKAAERRRTPKRKRGIWVRHHGHVLQCGNVLPLCQALKRRSLDFRRASNLMNAASKIIRTKNFVANAADFILEQARKAITERNEFRIALSGGNTPRPIYARLAGVGHDLPWDLIRITFGDERCVPPDNNESNFRMAWEALLAPAAVPEESILRMRGEIDPQIAAQEYQDHLDRMASQRSEPIYRHDLILLGLGDDGHTASLFPETAALDENTRRVVANFVSRLNAWRLTFTFPLINRARHILFLIGATKSSGLIDRVLAGDWQLPAARVDPSAGEVTWMIGE